MCRPHAKLDPAGANSMPIFRMAGQWLFVVIFDPNGRAQFNVNAQ